MTLYIPTNAPQRVCPHTITSVLSHNALVHTHTLYSPPPVTHCVPHTHTMLNSIPHHQWHCVSHTHTHTMLNSIPHHQWHCVSPPPTHNVELYSPPPVTLCVPINGSPQIFSCTSPIMRFDRARTSSGLLALCRTSWYVRCYNKFQFR